MQKCRYTPEMPHLSAESEFFFISLAKPPQFKNILRREADSFQPKYRAGVRVNCQMAHHPISLWTKLDRSCPSVLRPCPEEIKARWTLSEWSHSLAHSSWGIGGKSKDPCSSSQFGAGHTHTHLDPHAHEHTEVQMCIYLPTCTLLIYHQQWLWVRVPRSQEAFLAPHHPLNATACHQDFDVS